MRCRDPGPTGRRPPRSSGSSRRPWGSPAPAPSGARARRPHPHSRTPPPRPPLRRRRRCSRRRRRTLTRSPTSRRPTPPRRRPRRPPIPAPPPGPPGGLRRPSRSPRLPHRAGASRAPGRDLPRHRAGAAARAPRPADGAARDGPRGARAPDRHHDPGRGRAERVRAGPAPAGRGPDTRVGGVCRERRHPPQPGALARLSGARRRARPRGAPGDHRTGPARQRLVVLRPRIAPRAGAAARRGRRHPHLPGAGRASWSTRWPPPGAGAT